MTRESFPPGGALTYTDGWRIGVRLAEPRLHLEAPLPHAELVFDEWGTLLRPKAVGRQEMAMGVDRSVALARETLKKR